MPIVMDRSKRVVEPFKLAIATQRRGAVSYNPYVNGLHGMSGLSGIWNDILQLGDTWLSNRLQSAGIAGADIVGIQNQVGAAMDELSAQYYPMRDSGQVTASIISQFQQAMQTLVNSFCNRARQIGTSRALAGCSTIQYWGGKWIADREIEKASLTSTGVPGTTNTVIDPVTGLPVHFQTPPSSIPGTITSYMPIILGGVFIYVLMKSSKKW